MDILSVAVFFSLFTRSLYRRQILYRLVSIESDVLKRHLNPPLFIILNRNRYSDIYSFTR
jgi:hypothetical protein